MTCRHLSERKGIVKVVCDDGQTLDVNRSCHSANVEREEHAMFASCRILPLLALGMALLAGPVALQLLKWPAP